MVEVLSQEPPVYRGRVRRRSRGVRAEVPKVASELVWQAIGRHALSWSSPECPVAWYDNFVHLQNGVEGEPFSRVVGPRLYGVLNDLLGRDRWTWNEIFCWWPVLLPGFAAKASIGSWDGTSAAMTVTRHSGNQRRLSKPSSTSLTCRPALAAPRYSPALMPR